MIAETSRKRRRLERERRAIERPQPGVYFKTREQSIRCLISMVIIVRRIPVPPSEVPPALSLRKIVKTFPFVDKHKSQSTQSTLKQAIYPELSGLSSSEINADLEIFLSNQRYGFRGGDPVLGFPMQIGPPGNFGSGGYDGHHEHTMVGPIPPHPLPPLGSRMPAQQHLPPPPPPFAPPYMQPPHPGYGYPPPSGGNGRMPPPPPHGYGHLPGHSHVQHGHAPGHGSMPPPTHGGPSPGLGMYSDELIPPSSHHYYGSQQHINGGYPPDGVIPPPPGPNVGHHGRRSMSPMNGVAMNGKQGLTGHGGHHHYEGQSGWTGPGIAPPNAGAMVPGGYPGQGRPPPPPSSVSTFTQKGEWTGEERRREREYNVGFEEEERMIVIKEREAKGRDMIDKVDREQEKEREGKGRERDGIPMDVDRVTERERERDRHLQQVIVHRQQGQGPPGHSSSSGQPPSHSHLHNSMPSSHHTAIGGHHHPRAAPSSTSLSHHHHHHHHHVLHHHHGQSSAPTSGGSGSALLSPRMLAKEREHVEHEREREREKEGRPGSSSEHGQYPTETVNLNSKHGLTQPSQHLGRDNEHGDYRDRERDWEQNERERVRGRERTRLPSRRPSPSIPPPVSTGSGGAQLQAQPHGLVPGPGMETDRPIKTSFAMSSTQALQGSMMNVNGVSSPRGEY